MRRVGIRELKNNLSEYVRLARAGEVVQVTDRGTVVVEIRIPAAGGELEQRYPVLAEMARKGLVRLPVKPNHPDAYPDLPPVAPPGTAARLLGEERGER